ncbi:MAG: pseudouridine synthase [Bacteriovoracaceae bacterium]|jgi:RluA family pseudouridine synthase|nr:hypothetical protein [Halobacteriovoraceae bacterium]MDP7320091.1 pseudouridine synthase [Bacteriovoracaceae bacterium]
MIPILYEDQYYLIVEKPANLLVHRSHQSHEKDNLLKQVRKQTGYFTYPVHRLDRQASGILIMAKDSKYVAALQKIWSTDQVRKYYITLSRGKFLTPGSFEFDLSDKNKIKKNAITLFKPIKRFSTSTLLEVEIKTGRYHQIRRHFARSVEHILGDRKYGKKKYNDYYLEHYHLTRLFLHAHKIIFTHPFTNKEIIVLSKLTSDLQKTLSLMEKEELESFYELDYIFSHGSSI